MTSFSGSELEVVIPAEAGSSPSWFLDSLVLGPGFRFFTCLREAASAKAGRNDGHKKICFEFGTSSFEFHFLKEGCHVWNDF